MKINNILCSEKIKKKLVLMYGDYAGNRKSKEFVQAKIKRIIIICIITIVLEIVMIITSFDNDKSISKIDRNSYDGVAKTTSVITHIGNTGQEEKLILNIPEQKYSYEQLQSFLELIQEDIPIEILGNNTSLDTVITDLNLVSKIDKYPFKISWKSDKPLLINSNGHIDKAKIKEELLANAQEGITTRLCATLTYDDFVSDLYFYIVLKIDNSKNIINFMEDVEREIKASDVENKTKEYFELPSRVNGINVWFSYEKSYEKEIVGLLGIICTIGLCIAKDKEIDKSFIERNNQMNKDYPKILNQYALYACAGMNPRMIWEEICRRYDEKKREGFDKRYAYEEMLTTNREFHEGVGEIAAYESFARRCSNVKYRAFINIVEQSVKKGQERLDAILLEEVDKANREDNNRIRMSAQEISTKLLVPMVIMLLIVLVIVMVPAFISFNN